MPDGAVTRIEPHDDVLHIAILKRSLDEASAQQLAEDVMTAAVNRPHVPVVLDLNQVKFAPSVALGVLVRLSKSFQLDKRRITMIRIDPRVMGTIRVTQLHQVLEVYPTLDHVLKTLSS